MKKGDKIIFKHSVYLDACSEWPTQLLAKKDERGTIVEKSEWKEGEWKVQLSDENPFYASESDFKVIK